MNRLGSVKEEKVGSVRGSNDAVLAQHGELLGVHAQPRAEYVVDMLAEQR